MEWLWIILVLLYLYGGLYVLLKYWQEPLTDIKEDYAVYALAALAILLAWLPMMAWIHVGVSMAYKGRWW